MYYVFFSENRRAGRYYHAIGNFDGSEVALTTVYVTPTKRDPLIDRCFVADYTIWMNPDCDSAVDDSKLAPMFTESGILQPSKLMTTKARPV